MSGTDADPGPTREHLGGVLGGILLLLAIPAIALMIFGSQGGELDGAALWGEVFAAEPGEVGFEVERAARLPRGERVVVLDRTAGSSEGPELLVLMVYPSAGSVSPVMEGGSLPQATRRGPPRGGPPMGHDADEPMTLQSGFAEWGDLRARFVHTRDWKRPEGEAEEPAGDGDAPPPGGPAHRTGPSTDTIRVNLSAGRRYCVLFATWPEGVTAEVDELEDLLVELGFIQPESPTPR